MAKKTIDPNYHAAKGDNELKNSYDPAKLTPAEALALLSVHTETRKGKKIKRVHSFEGYAFAMAGCDIDLSDIKKYFKTSEHICLAGPNMRRAGHGVGFFHPKYKRYTFLETDKKKLDAIHEKREVKK